MNDVAAPEDKFGTTSQRYSLPALPADLPSRDLLRAANDFNEYRHAGLTAKQRLFIDEYLRNGLDATKAALAAGLASWSPDMAEARRVGRRLLRKEYIKQALDLAFAYHGESLKVELPRVIGEISKIAFATLADHFETDEWGKPHVKMADVSEADKWAALSEVSIQPTEFGTKYKIKQHSKLDALEKLLKFAAATGFTQPAAKDSGNPSAAGGTTVNCISMINIVPVPAGQFLPPPVIEAAPLAVEYSVEPNTA